MKKTSLIFALLISLVCFLSCSKDEVKCSINTTLVNLRSDGTYALIVSPSGVGWTFESGNNLIASVSSTGLIKANLVGTTTITIKNEAEGFTAQCKVTVTPIYTMYRDPYLEFGASKSSVKAYENRTLLSENTTIISYTGENAFLVGVAYNFENSAYKSVYCLVPTMYASLLGSFLAERYVYLGTSDNILISISPDNKTGVGVYVYSTSLILVIYISEVNATTPKSAKLNLETSSFNEIALKAKSAMESLSSIKLIKK
jgi:hypothetical protein